ncbi:MAG: MFS transporter [Planctomycetota bacterium]|jgi:UMF1 family MFS transporter
MDRKTVASWCFYDFGNSAFAVIFVTVYAAYYADGVAPDAQTGQDWWGWLVSASMALVAITSPLMGGIADHAGVRKRMLAIYTALGVLTTLGFVLVGPGALLLGFVLGVIANFAFEGGIVFYNSYLPVIAPPSHQGRVSAHGFAVGYVGSLLALGLGAKLADVDLINGVWVVVAVQWAIGALPALYFLPKDKPTGVGVFHAASLGIKQTVQTWKRVAGMQDLRRFLIGYFFYMDGVNTVIVFAAVYATTELDFGTAESIVLFAMVQLTALAGSLLMAGPSDRNGPRWAVVRTLAWWMFVVVLAILTGDSAFAWNKEAFWMVAGLAGLGLGSIQASSRALMSHLVPRGSEAEFFGFYALCGKTGAIAGPLLLTGLGSVLGSLRLGLISVLVFYAVGLWLVLKVKDPASP